MVGLLKYFKPKQCHEDNNNKVKPKGLPDPPHGDLNKVVPSSSIEVTNELYARGWRKNTGHVAHIFQ